MASVFLSYDRDDARVAAPIAVALEKSGHRVWWDRHIEGGSQFSKEIERALNEADVVVVIWSPFSIESAWVRDEAAVGRDEQRLVPISMAGTPPPLGFRQFHTIDLGRWSGRGKVPRLAELLAAIERQSRDKTGESATPRPAAPIAARPFRPWLIAGAALLAVLIIAASLSMFRTSAAALPIVGTAAADKSAGSRAMAQQLFAKLATLEGIGSGKWQLVDGSIAIKRPDILFQTADAGTNGNLRASLVMLDGRDHSVLWSRDFESSKEQAADLRQQIGLTAGRVLGCALDARREKDLTRDLLKLFLGGCADYADAALDAEPVVAAMGKVVAEIPDFTPAWSRLLLAQANELSKTEPTSHEYEDRRKALLSHIHEARKADPNLPEAFLAKATTLPPTAYGQRLALIARAKALAPYNPDVHGAESRALASVGRMSDAVDAAQRAAKLDPLSPLAESNVIFILALSGRVDAARTELARAERLWAGTKALREAQFFFHLRFGDPHIALRMAAEDGDNISPIFLRYRIDPSRENAARFVEQARKYAARASGYPLQGLGEAHAREEAFALIARSPTSVVATRSDWLFRPALSDVRNDPRFMGVANRIGLLNYWQTSGRWPDFCQEMDLPYDCKTEAAKLK